jgi:hypothetical protein
MDGETELLDGPGLTLRRLRVADADVVWLRSVLEAYEGLAGLYGDGSGVVTLTTTDCQAHELDALLDELAREAAIHRL